MSDLNHRCPYDGGHIEQIKFNEYRCLYCHTSFTEDELVFYQNSFNNQMKAEIDQIHNLRQEGDFYKVEGRVKHVLANPNYTNKNHLLSLYWQALLNEHYIVYEVSTSSNQRQYFPTFYKINYAAIMESEYYKTIVKLCHELSNFKALKSYETNVKMIDTHKRLFFELKKKHSKFDCFISFKHLDQGVETKDFKLAKRIYQELTSLNRNTFFSEETLKQITSEAYEPHIYYALFSSPLMILICTNKNYVSDSWVKNEWTRFLYMSKVYRKKLIVVLPTGFPKQELPEPLRLDMNGLERQFLFFENEEDLIDKLVAKMSFMDQTNRDYEKKIKPTEKKEPVKEIPSRGDFEKAKLLYDLQRYNEAFSELLILGNENHPEAQFMLGEMYFKGIGVTQDYFHSIEWYKKAAENGYVQAQLNLGNIYTYCNHILPSDRKKAFKWYQLASQNGSVDAHYELAGYYFEGTEVTQDYKLGISLYLKAAEQDNLSAQYQLGEIYSNGIGVDQDFKKAIEWYTKAAYQGIRVAYFKVAEIYFSGDESIRDVKKAIEWYMKAAEYGDDKGYFKLETLYNNGDISSEDFKKAIDNYSVHIYTSEGRQKLGELFYNGNEEIKDYKKAFEYFMELAERGDSNARFRVGYMYEHGQGVPIDYKKAAEWYKRGANSDNYDAICGLGYAYLQGYVSKDYREAYQLFQKAANKGHALSQYYLGYMYHNGIGTPRDYVTAFNWYTKSAENGNVEAQYQLGLFFEKGYNGASNPEKAFEWYSKAAGLGHILAKTSLGNLNLDVNKSFQWNLKLAENGNVFCQYNVALMYEQGKGVKRNFTSALEWCNKAAEHGWIEAQFHLGEMYETGKGIKKDFLEAHIWYKKAAKSGNKEAELKLNNNKFRKTLEKIMK